MGMSGSFLLFVKLQPLGFEQLALFLHLALALRQANHRATAIAAIDGRIGEFVLDMLCLRLDRGNARFQLFDPLVGASTACLERNRLRLGGSRLP